MIVYNLHMRKLIYGFSAALDGALARSNGAVDFTPRDREARQRIAALFARVDTVVMGRKTAEAVAHITGKAEPPAWPGVANYVFSRTWPPGKRNTFETVDMSPADFLRRLRRRRGKHILLMGGGELGRSFLAADLVDELHLGLAPVLLGEGARAFPPGFSQREFKLLECGTYSRNSVSLCYRRARR